MRLIDADLLRKQFRKRELEKNCRYMNGAMICNVRKIIDEAPTVERPHGECRTCKHFVKGGLDGKTYVCEHPNIEQEDYYDYACLMVEENDFCSSYEARKKEGDEK